MYENYLEEARRKKNWYLYVMLHERPHRLEIFYYFVRDNLKDRAYWSLLRYIWMDAEFIYNQRGIVRRLLGSARKKRIYFMEKSEREFLKKLPEQIKVYRGHIGKNESGWSWTLSLSQAIWFAKRINSEQKFVAIGHVKKAKVIGFINGRGEKEIVADPRHVTVIRNIELMRSPR